MIKLNQKLKKLLASTAIVTLMLGSTSVFAAEEKDTLSIQKLNSPIKLEQLVNNKPTIGLRAPAPALTGIYIMGVASPQGGAEYMTTLNQYSTGNDHGGDWIQVLTLEVGYGQNRSGLFNGRSMQIAESSPADLNGDGIVDGFYYLWESYRPFTEGAFETKATSINFPVNTLSNFINVK